VIIEVFVTFIGNELAERLARDDPESSEPGPNGRLAPLILESAVRVIANQRAGPPRGCASRP
jgi:hypothetical protein